ncbi:MAG: gamma-glutamyltransferase, partial [Sulfolobus sp.]|nr:gamma-glutamyltransferase [Sulfolobus sp.]
MPSHVDKKMVVSQHYLATIIGKSIFEKGGNAFDVAITTSSLVSLLLPHTSGLGGDAFLLASTPEGLIAYNASGWAPKNIKEFMNPRDVGTVLIPGLVDLWDFINSSHYNKLTLDQDLAPAISLARNGFYVGRELSNAIIKARQDIIDNDWHKLFGDKYYGDKINFPKLAEILKKISNEPRDFYEGKTAEELITALNNKGLSVELSDFSEYKGDKVTPLKSSYKDYTLYELPPNSQGITTLQLLKLIEISNINRNKEFYDTERIKAHLELTKKAYKDRDSYVADPRFTQTPVNMLLNENYLVRLIESSSVNNTNIKQDGDTTFL